MTNQNSSNHSKISIHILDRNIVLGRSLSIQVNRESWGKGDSKGREGRRGEWDTKKICWLWEEGLIDREDTVSGCLNSLPNKYDEVTMIFLIFHFRKIGLRKRTWFVPGFKTRK